MNKLLKREFLPVGEETQKYVNSNKQEKEFTRIRKRWFATMQCQQCGKEFTVLERSKEHHLKKPCEACSLKNIAYKNFIKRAEAKHKGKFDYSLVTEENYVNLFTPVQIICKQHGVFEQKPRDHTLKAGGKLCCPVCIHEFNKIHNKRSIESWKEELSNKAPHIIMVQHGNSESNTEECVLECLHHGQFTSKLADIKNQVYICPLCAQDHNSWGGRFRRTDIKGILYFIYIPELGLWKLGVTSKSVQERLRQLKYKYTVLWEVEYSTLAEAYENETLLFKQYKNSRRDQNLPKVLGKCKGNSELMTCEIPNPAIQCSNTLSKEP